MCSVHAPPLTGVAAVEHGGVALKERGYHLIC